MSGFLTVQGVVKRFGSFTALADIDLQVAKGEFLCLLGPSGCGKTTLLRIIAGLETQDAGTVRVEGRDISHLPPAQRDYGIVFQNYALFPNLNVAENIGYGLRSGRAARQARTEELLALVGLSGNERKYPSQLSGGQQQRVAVARAVGGRPSILLADEPTGNLDSTNGDAVMDLLKSLHRRGSTICMVTHDPRFAQHADRTVHLFDGRIVEESAVRA